MATFGQAMQGPAVARMPQQSDHRIPGAALCDPLLRIVEPSLQIWGPQRGVQAYEQCPQAQPRSHGPGCARPYGHNAAGRKHTRRDGAASKTRDFDDSLPAWWNAAHCQQLRKVPSDDRSHVRSDWACSEPAKRCLSRQCSQTP